MRFLRGKLLIIGVSLLTILCIAAVYIAVNITVTMLSKQDQLIKGQSSGQSVAANQNKKLINIDNAKEAGFFFNGQSIKGASALVAGKNQYFVPFDVIMDLLGIKYSYFSSDDIFETVIDKKKLTIKLYKESFIYNGKEIMLSACPVPSKQHVFVPIDLLSAVPGFKTYEYGEDFIAFVNYYTDYENGNESKIQVLRQNGGFAQVSDIFNKKQFWDRKGSFSQNEKFYVSSKGNTSIVKTDDKIYIVSRGKKVNPYLVNINPAATLSIDGRYLYWADMNQNTSYIYDIENDYVKKIGNYFSRIKTGDPDGNLINGGVLLSDYRDGSYYKRVSLTNEEQNSNYTFIERGGRVVLKGNMIFSPDGKRVIHYKDGYGYYAAGSDGSYTEYMGDGTQAVWITNNKILLKTENGSELFEGGGSFMGTVGNNWRRLGNTVSGDILYTDGTNVFCETNGSDKWIMPLPQNTKYIYSLSQNGPYIIVFDDPTNSVVYMNGTVSVKLGSSSLLTKKSSASDFTLEYSDCIQVSPDKAFFSVLQMENGFIAVNLIDKEGKNLRKIVLNGKARDAQVSVKWLSNRKFIVYTSKEGWIVDFSKDPRVLGWTEAPSCNIRGIIVP